MHRITVKQTHLESNTSFASIAVAVPFQDHHPELELRVKAAPTKAPSAVHLTADEHHPQRFKLENRLDVVQVCVNN